MFDARCIFNPNALGESRTWGGCKGGRCLLFTWQGREGSLPEVADRCAIIARFEYERLCFSFFFSFSFPSASVLSAFSCCYRCCCCCWSLIIISKLCSQDDRSLSLSCCFQWSLILFIFTLLFSQIIILKLLCFPINQFQRPASVRFPFDLMHSFVYSLRVWLTEEDFILFTFLFSFFNVGLNL